MEAPTVEIGSWTNNDKSDQASEQSAEPITPVTMTKTPKRREDARIVRMTDQSAMAGDAIPENARISIGRIVGGVSANIFTRG